VYIRAKASVVYYILFAGVLAVGSSILLYVYFVPKLPAEEPVAGQEKMPNVLPPGYGEFKWGATHDEVESHCGQLTKSRTSYALADVPGVEVYAAKEHLQPFDSKKFCFFQGRLWRVETFIEVPHEVDQNRIMTLIEEELKEIYGERHDFRSDSFFSKKQGPIEGYVDSTDYWYFPNLVIAHHREGPWGGTKDHSITFTDRVTRAEIRKIEDQSFQEYLEEIKDTDS
jgi:hypothetical protein